MSHHNRKSLWRRGLRVEILESRELLSADLASARPAVEAAPAAKVAKLIYGSLEGQGVESGTKLRGTDHFDAAGPEAPVGTGTFNASTRYKAVIEGRSLVGFNNTDGTGTLIDSSGDKLNLQFSGNIYESGPTYAFTWDGTVDGGTGQYKGATGDLHAYGTYSISTGQFTVLSYTVTLSRR
jgi:hypothetical protein